MTSKEALVGLPDGDVTRTRAIARLVPAQRWNPESILAVKGVPAKTMPRNPADDTVIESFANPHLSRDADLKVQLEDEEQVTTDMPACLHPDRRVPSLRITKGDLERYGYTLGCPRCLNTQMGGTAATANHWDACRRRIYRALFRDDDPKFLKWLSEHEGGTAKVWPALGMQSSVTPASSSTAPPPGRPENSKASSAKRHAKDQVHETSDPKDVPLPAPPAPGDLEVFDNANAGDFTRVVSLLVSNGVAEVDAQRLVCSLAKPGHDLPKARTGFFELYGQGWVSRAARKHKGLSVHGLEVLDLSSLKPDGNIVIPLAGMTGSGHCVCCES